MFNFNIKSFSFLICPVSKNLLFYNKKTNELISKATFLAFPIVKGVPILLLDQSRFVK